MHTSIKQALGFTLVELIVVITIVAILSTVGFVSYSWYLTGARDSNRISQMIKLSDSLQVYSATKTLPLPDDYVEVHASWTLIAYQWDAWVDVLETIDFTNGWKDPKNDDYFTYYLTKDRKSLQLMAMMEEEGSVAYNQDRNGNTSLNSLLTGEMRLPGIQETFATDYTDRYPKVYWRKLWILTQTSTNTPIQQLSAYDSTAFDVVTETGSFVANISDEDKITWTGAQISSMMALKNSDLAEIDESLIWYWIFDSDTSPRFLDKSLNWNELSSSGVVLSPQKAMFSKSSNSRLTWSGYTLWDNFSILLKARPTWSWSTTSCWSRNILSQSVDAWCTNTSWNIWYTYHASSTFYDQQISFTYWNGTSGWWVTNYSVNQSFIGKEILVVLVKKGGTMSMYINGSLDSQFPITNMQNNAYPLYIWWWALDYFDWEIYKIAIYNKSLSDNEIQFAHSVF